MNNNGMRVMFTINKVGMSIEQWTKALDKVGMGYVRRGLYIGEEYHNAFIVSANHWYKIRYTWKSVNRHRWWTISSCNKQYINEYSMDPNSTCMGLYGVTGSYLGCITECSFPWGSSKIQDKLLITGDGKTWEVREEGSPSKLISDYRTPEGYFTQQRRLPSLKSTEPWPKDRHAPVAIPRGVVQEMREMQESTLRRLKWSLTLMSRAQQEFKDALEDLDD